MQWGLKIGNNNYTLQTLPISCNYILSAVSCASGNHWEHASCTYDFTSTSLRVAVASGVNGAWIAICS